MTLEPSTSSITRSTVGTTQDPEMVWWLEGTIASGATAFRESDEEPALIVGDRVRVMGDNPRGPTDKADCIRGNVGIVVVNDATCPPTGTGSTTAAPQS